MSDILQYPDDINPPALQIWNNAAFDNGGSADTAPVAVSWSGKSVDSFSSKENHSPVFGKSSVSIKSPAMAKPLQSNGLIGNSQGKPPNLLLKQENEKKIDTEIEEIEIEISRLSSRLEVLRIEKAKQNSKTAEKRGRFVPAKFMDQKSSFKDSDVVKKLEEPMSNKIHRRGFSLGPSEIIKTRQQQMGRPEIQNRSVKDSEVVKKLEEPMNTIHRRGVSLGPSEIIKTRQQQMGRPEIQNRSIKDSEVVKKLEEPMNTIHERGFSLDPSEMIKTRKQQMGRPETQNVVKKFEEPMSKIHKRGVSLGPSEIIKLRQLGRPENITPAPATQQHRRKSWFWNLPEIDEQKVTIQRGKKSSSVSPKSRKPISKIPNSRQAITTVGPKKGLKKDDCVLSTIQPKKLLFKEGEKSTKKGLKPGRVVPSRYNNQSTVNSSLRKRSFPETDGEDGDGKNSKRGSWVSSQNSMENVTNFLSISEFTVLLPKISTDRCAKQSPRDSGAAKRVADLVGKRNYFGIDEEGDEPIVCQNLSFGEEDDEDL